MIVWKLEDFIVSSSINDRSFKPGSRLRMVRLSGNSRDSNIHNNLLTQVIPVVLLGTLFVTWLLFICCRRRNPNREAAGDPEGFNGETNVGLDKTVIESFPVVSFRLARESEAQVEWSGCVVCLSEFEQKEKVRLLTRCNHAFHPDCVDMWLFSHSTCPLCRSTLLPKKEDSSNTMPAEADMNGPSCTLTQEAASIDNLEDGSRSFALVRDGLWSGKVVCKARSERWASITNTNRASFLGTLSERYVPFCVEI